MTTTSTTKDNVTTTAAAAAVVPAQVRRLGRLDAQIVEILRKKGLLSEEQLQRGAALQQEQGGAEQRLADVLVRLGFVERADVVAARAASVGLPFAVLSERMVQPDAVHALPPEFCEKHNVLPVMLAGDWLTVAVEEFTNLFLIEEVKKQARRQVLVLAADGENIRQVRREVLRTGGDAPAGAAMTPEPTSGSAKGADGNAAEPAGIRNELDELLVVSSGKKEEEEDDTPDLQAAAAGSPIVKLVNHVVRTAVDSKASDIHIEPEEGQFRIRYRVDGDLVTDPFRPSLKLLPAVVSRIKIIAGLDISERRLPQDGVVKVISQGRPIELRVSTMATPIGEKVVMRVVNGSTKLGDLAQLGFNPVLLEHFRAAVREPHGMVVVTGPTGSGKSTTLYSALSEIITPQINISTVEDPVERRIPGVNQFQVNPKANFTFAKALRSLLRQDPDVVMIGEIRDGETAKIATEAALTGHMVLSTLHTNDAPSAVPRLANMGVEPYLIAAALKAILAQRLAPRLCEHCKVEVPVTTAVRGAWENFTGKPCPVEATWEGKGCPRCRNSGRSGRTAVHELLILREEAFDGLGSELSLKTIRQVAAVSPYWPLATDCLEKVMAGQISANSLLELLGQGEPAKAAA